MQAPNMHKSINFKFHGSIELFRQITHGKCFKTLISNFMGQSSCFAELRMENASKLKFQNSCVNRFGSKRQAPKMHNSFNFKFHMSIELFRQITHGKCFKTSISNFMCQSSCFAKLRIENASKL